MLAEVADIEARLEMVFTEGQLPKINALLTDASAAVRNYTKQAFELVEDDEIIVRPVGIWLRLPQRPVVEVVGVKAVSGWGSDFTLTAWTFDGVDKINIRGQNEQIVNYPEWWYADEGVNTYKVTYSHGYETIPADVVAVVCAMVMRVITSPTQIGGMVSERIGQYFYQMQQSMGTAGASIRLNGDDKSVLDAYRKKATTIQLVGG